MLALNLSTSARKRFLLGSLFVLPPMAAMAAYAFREESEPERAVAQPAPAQYQIIEAMECFPPGPEFKLSREAAFKLSREAAAMKAYGKSRSRPGRIGPYRA